MSIKYCWIDVLFYGVGEEVKEVCPPFEMENDPKYFMTI
jgi:hypothetical protein